jgi:hypothetical protein
MKGCRSCKNWQALDEHLDRIDPATAGHPVQMGICRRYAPRPIEPRTASESPEARWPRVASDDWCGEWDPDFS